MSARIVIITQWFDPEPTFKGLLFAKTLVSEGFDVLVITGFPNYPSGKIYPGYKVRFLQLEKIDGINLTRLPLYPSHNKSVIKRCLNYASFALAAMFYGLFKIRRGDIIYAYHPPLSVGIAACIIRKLKDVIVVYDIQDMWPDTLRATGILNSHRLFELIAIVCNWVYRHVDAIVVLSPGFKRLLLERGVVENKIEIIYNWADEDALTYQDGILPVQLFDNNDFNIVFAGNIGMAQGLDSLFSAANLLQSWGSRVKFFLIGDGIELIRLKQEAVDKGLRNIKFLPQVPMKEIGLLLSSADALLVHLKKDPLFKVTIPSKTQAYMCVGKPVLMAVEGDAANLIKESRGGVVVEPENPKALAEAAEDLASMPKESLRQMGERAKSYYDNNLSLSVGVKRFSEIFHKFI